MSTLLSPTLSKLWRVSLPLMLITLSANLMLLLDRLVLVRYSAEAMNAAAVAGMSCAIFQFGGVAITSIAEVFVGQYNGAGQYEKASRPVWQMIWFSLGLFVISWPIALWAGAYVLPVSLHKEGLPYFKWVMLFSPFMAMVAALSAFFIGRGLIKLVTWCTLIGNLINVALNMILVFGIEGWISSRGTKGSAIATVIAQGIQVLILASVFLNKYHQKNFKTGNWGLNSKLLWDCLKVGVPSAISHMIEIAAWAALFRIAASVDLGYVTIQTIGNSVLVFFTFVSEGIQKGVIAIASNLIGARKDNLISKLFISGLKLHLFSIIAFSVPLVFHPNLIIYQFLPGAQDPTSLLYGECVAVLKWVWVYFLFDGVVWILGGILTAGGDTRFIMLMNASAAWVFAILPIYIAVHYFHVNSSTAWGLCTIYGVSNAIAFFLRYASSRWKKFVINDQF